MLILAIGDETLTHPGHSVLVDRVRRNPASRRRVSYRRIPVRDAHLHVRLLIYWHWFPGPHHRERVRVVDRGPVLKVRATHREDVRHAVQTRERPVLVLF